MVNDIMLQVKKNRMNDRICAIENERKLTYSELDEFAVTYGDWLAIKMESKTHVGILLGNSIEYLKWFYTCISQDVVVVPINPQSTSYEITNYIKTCDLHIVITNMELRNKIEEENIYSRLDVILADQMDTVTIHPELSYATIAESGFSELITTSGSSSLPKCVMLTLDNLQSNAKDIIESLEYTKDDIFLVLLPVCFASGNTSQLVVTLLLGATIVFFKEPMLPQNIMKAIQKYQVTTTTIVPSILHLLLKYRGLKDAVAACTSLKRICFGGGKTCESDMKLAYEIFGHVNLTQMYGQTEASTRISHLHAFEAKTKYGSVGKPLSHIQVKIVDEMGVELPYNSIGEIAVSGPNIMKGYYKNKKATDETLRESWLMTGDIGRIDEDGYLYITGRKKNIIIHSGINIYPEEIENILLMCHGINDAYVYGENEDAVGEIIKVDVELREGEQLTEQEIMVYCIKHLPDYKVPESVRIVKALPRTPNGKLKRGGA